MACSNNFQFLLDVSINICCSQWQIMCFGLVLVVHKWTKKWLSVLLESNSWLKFIINICLDDKDWTWQSLNLDAYTVRQFKGKMHWKLKQDFNHVNSCELWEAEESRIFNVAVVSCVTFKWRHFGSRVGFSRTRRIWGLRVGVNEWWSVFVLALWRTGDWYPAFHPMVAGIASSPNMTLNYCGKDWLSQYSAHKRSPSLQLRGMLKEKKKNRKRPDHDISFSGFTFIEIIIIKNPASLIYLTWFLLW